MDNVSPIFGWTWKHVAILVLIAIVILWLIGR